MAQVRSLATMHCFLGLGIDLLFSFWSGASLRPDNDRGPSFYISIYATVSLATAVFMSKSDTSNLDYFCWYVKIECTSAVRLFIKTSQ